MYVGRVYDGTTGDQVTRYTLVAEYMDVRMDAAVDENGRYLVGPVLPGHDFTIEIDHEGYRSFMAHNAQFEDEDTEDIDSFYFDAYLFPSNLPSPEVTFDIHLAQTDADATGLIRLAPAGQSSLYDDAAEQPAGVPTQVWFNDEDLQASTVATPFSGSSVTFAEGDLVYGVNYNVTVYDVDEYQDFTATFQSGIDGHQSYVLSHETDAPLALVFASTELGIANPSGEAILVFNQPIAFFDSNLIDRYEEALDDNFAINSPDADIDGEGNLLPVDEDELVRERGTSMVIEGDTLTLRWNFSSLLESDSDDPIEHLIYGGLNSIELLATRGPITNRASVGTLLGSDSITVDLRQ